MQVGYRESPMFGDVFDGPRFSSTDLEKFLFNIFITSPPQVSILCNSKSVLVKNQFRSKN